MGARKGVNNQRLTRNSYEGFNNINLKKETSNRLCYKFI